MTYNEILDSFAYKSKLTMFHHVIDYIKGEEYESFYLEPVPSMARYILGDRLAEVAFSIYLPFPSPHIEVRLFININHDLSTTLILTYRSLQKGDYVDEVSTKNLVTFQGGVLPGSDSRGSSLDEALHELLIRNTPIIEQQAYKLIGSRLGLQIS